MNKGGHFSPMTDNETGLTVTVRPLDHGRCCLTFEGTDLHVAINSSRRSFITASLGARSHFASIEGACEFIRIGDKVRVKVQQWRGPFAEMDVDRLEFQTAIKALADSEDKTRPEIKLF